MTATALTQQCQLGQHEHVGALGRSCDGRGGRCPCQCHVVAATDRTLLERTADERCAADPASVLELAAHLRTAALPEHHVERVAVLVLDLGWRRVLGWGVDPARRLPDPLVVPASTVRALDSGEDHVADGALEDLLSRLAEAEGRRARPAREARLMEVPGA